MSRNWQRVAKNIQKLAAGMYAVKSEASFPYETHYVLATDEEVERLHERGTTTGAWRCYGQTIAAVEKPRKGCWEAGGGSGHSSAA